MIQILLINLVLVIIYMTCWWYVAYRRKRLDTVDIAWGLSFVLIAWSVYLQQPSLPSLAIGFLVTLWGVRLANHIWSRSRSHNEDDPRYKEISRGWSGNFWLRAYFSIFLLQGGLAMIVSLPIVYASGNLVPERDWLTWFGAWLWTLGFVIEAISDKQLADFLKQKNRPKVLNTGLWRYSRHPNYFGELVQWWAIGVIALQASFGWIGLSGPLFLSFLIIFVSGIPPIERRRIKDTEYIAYQKRTSVLVPWPPRKA